MFRIIDRYLIREMVVPFALSLMVLTFVLDIPPILREAEAFIAKGVEWPTVAHVLVLLLPQALGLTIPMSVLLGILIGFGRLSADREFVAIQSCGVSLFRLLRPVLAVALVATAADAYVMIVALPDANQTFRQIAFQVAATKAESNVAPRVFFDTFPNRTIYVRDTVLGSGWREVFLADTTKPDETTVYFAKEGRLIVDREARTVTLELRDGTRHTTSTRKPNEHESADYARLVLQLDPETVFPRITPPRGIPEMSIAELRASIAEGMTRNDPGYGQQYQIQLKFAIPVATLVLAMIGLALGVSHRKDGFLASLVLGIGVIFIYYVLLWTARATALGGRFPAAWAPWIPNALFSVVAVVLLLRRARSADQPLRIRIPAFWRRSPEPAAPRAVPGAPPAGRAPGGRTIVLVIRVPRLALPRPGLLDLYVTRRYVRILVLGVVSLLGIFYISTFMDVADKLFRGSATSALLLRYFYFLTPQYVYYVIPMSVLIATLVTIGVMTKDSELVVIKACGISLYRTAAPLLLFALAGSAVLYGLQERVMAFSNREADRLQRQIRGLPPLSIGALDRRWLIGQQGDIYHYERFDSAVNQFTQLTVYHLSPSAWDVRSITRAARVALVPTADAEGQSAPAWQAYDGWTREFSRGGGNAARSAVTYAPFAERTLALEPPGYFKTDQPLAELMTYGQLKRYAGELRAGGYNAVPHLVALQRKIAFPFVTVVMTLLAVPFAVTTGRRGALYGVGIGIVLAIVYWLMLSVFAAVGAGGLLSPVLAAWAPNGFFLAAALYLILTVRT